MTHDLNFSAFSNALPPQNVDAEESILGGILLDPEAMGRVADVLRPEAFISIPIKKSTKPFSPCILKVSQ
jgi:replicative DNA helicase